MIRVGARVKIRDMASSFDIECAAHFINSTDSWNLHNHVFPFLTSA